MAVMTVLAEAIFEFLDACGEEGNLRLQCRDKAEGRLRPLIIKALELLTCHHTFYTAKRGERVSRRRQLGRVNSYPSSYY